VKIFSNYFVKQNSSLQSRPLSTLGFQEISTSLSKMVASQITDMVAVANEELTSEDRLVIHVIVLIRPMCVLFCCYCLVLCFAILNSMCLTKSMFCATK